MQGVDHETHEEHRDVVAGHLAHTVGSGNTRPGFIFQRTWDDNGNTSCGRWNLHPAAEIDQRRAFTWGCAAMTLW